MIVTGSPGVTRTRKGITGIAVGFNQALNPSSAMNPAFYSAALGVRKRKGLVFSKGVRIGGVTYNGAAHSVTIVLAKATKGTIEVIIRGGIVTAAGAVTSGNFTVIVK
jgi:hypothetical protein